VRELLARIRVLLRRSVFNRRRIIRFGDVEIDPERSMIPRCGNDVSVTPCKYNLPRAPGSYSLLPRFAKNDKRRLYVGRSQVETQLYGTDPS
jgi:DNA-binding response OmpR family regulator